MLYRFTRKRLFEGRTMIKKLFRQMSNAQIISALSAVSHIGIRMIMGIVKEADYVNTLGLNNLTLVL